ncbi:MAG: MFS transporter [Rhizobiaceae bacterium]
MPTDYAGAAASPRRGLLTDARLIMAVFFLQPIAFGAWLPRIPDIQEKLGLGPADLAFALLGMPVGTLLTLPLAGRFVAHIGSRATILWLFPIFLGVVALPPFASNIIWLFFALAIVGVVLSTLELGLNVEADKIEKSGTALIMNTCHGFWSLGIMAGSLIGSGLAALAVAPHWAVIATALAVLPLAIFSSIALPAYKPTGAAAPEPPAQWKLPGKALLGICLFVFGITMTEGAIADWSAVFLRDVFSAEPAIAGIGYSVFAGMVAGGRFIGDRLKARLGAVATARLCGCFSLAGMALIVLAPSSWLVFAGFAATGFGVSVGFPLAVTAAAGLTDRPTAASVAILSFIALTGFLLGPPMIGLVAEHVDLRAGLATLLPFLLISLALTGVLADRKAAR